MTSITKRLAQIGILPILTLDDAASALLTVEALMSGGIGCGEVTFRTAAAADAIHQISTAYPDFLIGAGTIITVAQAEAAREAGAKYLIAPGFSAEVAHYCRTNSIPLFPGVMTPTDISQAMAFGLTTLKLFPAGAAGGIQLLKALAGPFHTIDFVPTGGVNAQNLADYLRLPNVALCGGSWLARRDTIARGDYGEIERLSAEAVTIVKRVRSPSAA